MTFEEVHHLIKHGDAIALRRELDNGLDPNLTMYSASLLMLVALKGDTQLGELLISRGADVNKRNSVGETALSLAAYKGFPSFVQLLLDRGATTNLRPHGVSLSKWMRTSGLPQEKIVAILNLIENHKKIRSPSILDRCVNAFIGLIVGGAVGMLALYFIMFLAGSDFGLENVRPGTIIGAAVGFFLGWRFPVPWYWHLFP